MFLYVVILSFHIIVSIALIIAVLLQSSKGGGLAGTFGGSGITGGVFGGRGAAPFLAKATTIFAVLFMLTSVTLNFVRPDRSSRSTIEKALMEGGDARSTPAVSTEMPVSSETSDENVDVGSEQNNTQKGSTEAGTDNNQ
ncbi:MAG: preprotein translocase subunit SecG [Candidatus Latescibacteria bacterium]|nr:preprotein translocase subunit SecG [Candidatus Latescibacterota bacterium]